MPETWHGQMGFQLTGFWMFILMTIGLASIMSFVYVKTNRSMLSAMLMHLFSNFTAQLFSTYSSNVELFSGILVLAIGAVICIHMIRTKKDAFRNYTLPHVV